MQFCIENEDGEFYAGTQEGKVWQQLPADMPAPEQLPIVEAA